MEEKSGAQISQRAFIQSFLILLFLMIAAGLLTVFLPGGSYQIITKDGRDMIDPASYQTVAKPDYPAWRWALAPFELLGAPGSAVVITIIVFIILVAGAFAVLDKSGILNAAIARLVRAFGGRKYLLLLGITFFFMVLGAFLGLFEEVVPLTPIMIALAYYLGWDVLVGLGMSILATNMGFSAALTNPFTIGVAQKIAGLPLFSGLGFRVVIFLVVYALLAAFLVTYARRIERRPESSLVYQDDQSERARFGQLSMETLENKGLRLKPALGWFAVFVVLIIVTLFCSSFVPGLSDYSLPLVGLLFFIGGVGAGLLSGVGNKVVWKALGDGVLGIAPGIPLILMAASVKYIISSGGVMDTILHMSTQLLAGTSAVTASWMVYLMALVVEFFVASAGAKAVLIMPILLPIADMVGVTRQVAVLAYCFGDGFSNMLYPTNPVLLITLGLASISYPKWLRWTAVLWAGVVVVTLLALWIGVAIHYGPF
jgi:uncharacterized ion transporter superfamily protein YfcC